MNQTSNELAQKVSESINDNTSKYAEIVFSVYKLKQNEPLRQSTQNKYKKEKHTSYLSVIIYKPVFRRIV